MELSDSTLDQESVSTRDLLRYEKVELCAFIELAYWRGGTVPTAKELRQEFGVDISDRQYEEFCKDPAVRKQLVEKQGVPLDAAARLTPKQLAWIRTITDPADYNPISVKLKMHGLTKSEVDRWLSNPMYQQVLYEQSNRSFGDARHAVLRALANEAMGGHFNAIQMYLKMTGDFQDKTEIQVNSTVEIKATMNVVLDILQRHVPREVLEVVAMEMEQAVLPAVVGASPVAGLPMIPIPPRKEIKALPKPKPVRQELSIDDDF